MTYAELREQALTFGVEQGWLAIPVVGKRPIKAYGEYLDKPWSLDAFWAFWDDTDENTNPVDGFAVVWPSDIVQVEADGPEGATWISKQGFPETVVFSSARGPHYLFKGRVDGLNPKPHPEVEVLGRPSKTLMFVPPQAGKSWLGGCAPGERSFAGVPNLPRSRAESPGRTPRTGAFAPERGERNVELTKVAGHLRNAGLDQPAIQEMLSVLNESEGIGLPDAEIRSIAKSSNSWAIKEKAPEQTEDEFWLNWDGEDEPYDWLYYPVLPRAADVRLYGASGSAKSMLAAWWAAELSHKGIRSSYYSEENPRSTDRDRLRRMAPNPGFFRLASNRGINLADTDAIERLIERDKDRDLIILDTYIHVYAPSWDVERNQKAADHGKAVDRIIQGTGACVVTIDHTGFRGEEMRDASAKKQQADIAILVSHDNEWEGPGHPAAFKIRNMKATRFGNPFTARGAVVDFGSKLVIQWDWHKPREMEWGAHGVVKQ